MERVQFQQEQMLQELKDLVDKKLFTEKETRQIMKKRTAFETALVRRVAKKSDFLRYASYEMGLEHLRRKRVERLNIPPGPPSISDYALVRRQFHIFERALKKFKSDIGLWIQYIQIAKQERARALVGRITARALQLHPNKPAFYVLAASHELSHQSPSSARALLQRGIRLNPDSVEMWREYVRMELGFIESLRRRWDVLGIQLGNSNEKGKGKARDDKNEDVMGLDVGPESNGETSMEVDFAMQGDEARRNIMEGAIVKSVIANAAKALPTPELFEALTTLISEYPSPAGLRNALLDHVYDVLRQTLPNNAKALRQLADRFTTPEMTGAELVDGLRRANEEMLAQIGEGMQEELLEAYAQFVEDWCDKMIDDNLKLYLISNVQTLIARAKRSPSLLSTHMKLLTRYHDIASVSPASVLDTGRKYTRRAGSAASVWLARLDAERKFCDDRGTVMAAWTEARRSVAGSDEEVCRVWTWGVSHEEAASVKAKMHEGLLKESMGDGLGRVHDALLMSYVTALEEAIEEPDRGKTWLDSIRHMARSYLTTGEVWQKVFAAVEACEERVVAEVYEQWRQKAPVDAAVGWAGWLVAHGKGREAVSVVQSGRGDGEKGELETRWKRILDEA